MSLNGNRALFLEECKQRAFGETQLDAKNLQEFFTTELGMLIIGRLRVYEEEKTRIGPLAISTIDPNACASALAKLQGEIFGICNCIDRLLGDNEDA